MTTTLIRLLLTVPLILFLAVAATAPMPKIAVARAECVPDGDNGVIYATIDPEIGGTYNRLYFRWEDDEDFYYVALHGIGGGLWAEQEEQVEQQI